MAYRTKTYIAADWTGDSNAVEQLHKWNDSDYWGLSFHDAHDIIDANDGSLNCSIKASLAKRLDISKTFVLVVGNGTKTRRAGECNYCSFYSNSSCTKGYGVSNKSFIEYECDKAVRDGLTIVVLYNAAKVDKTKCIDSIKEKGTHTAMQYIENGQRYWDYQAVKKAFGQ
jgi:hypothetical protein